MTKPSLRYIARELEISPAYLSYMVNGKRPWRKDLYQRYMGVVNTFVNSEGPSVNKTPKKATLPDGLIKRGQYIGGSARESNPPTPLVTRHNGFEVTKKPCLGVVPHAVPSTVRS